ncbi:uncharacterized protein A1O5_09079 [Cladophialophora psammophila CBS 110553]|uniref:Uncharacterized protein n=1 Tax=Cladophialophora psammophila CBS 110553 TaxID=1182543 RepID=W9WIH5_9EURO|nr:uncharacterized protein A1O5_09079 [Cladophialophora psammophila CBS 110553]EXJ67733.1 hypothetical protein A1O5_09079 [Cladophialophora psammophila CBS 110553]
MSESTEPVHDGVDEFVVAPIRVSLLATIDDENTAYKDPNKTDRYSLFEARTVDIWETVGRGAQVVDRSYPLSRRLPPDLFEAYHPSIPPRGSRLALRLLCTRPALGVNQTAKHDDTGPPGDRQINYLPFLAADVQEPVHQWDLNREYTWMRLHAREVGNFQRRTVWSFDVEPPRALRMGLVIHFPFVLRPARRAKYLTETKGGRRAPEASRRSLKSSMYNPRRDDPFLWSFAMSHSLRDGKTRCLLDGLTDWAIGDVSRRLLKASQQWYVHPLHVPVILLGIFFDHAAWEVNRLCVEVGHFESLSRAAQIGSLEHFDNITTQLQYVRRNLDFLRSLAKFLLETMEFLEQKIFLREWDGGGTKGGGAKGGGRGGDDTFASYRTYVYQTNPHMEEKLMNISHLIENNLSTCLYLQARTRDALDFIKGKISLRDNESGREDADSNKTMSFLQMVFLPATFVAAIVSMNFFDLTTSPPRVSGYIWIFWVVSLGLTALVLGLYFFWRWRGRLKAQDEQAEARRREMALGFEEEGGGGGESGYGTGTGTASEDEEGGGRRRKKRRRRRSRRGRRQGRRMMANEDSADDGWGAITTVQMKEKEKPELVM